MGAAAVMQEVPAPVVRTTTDRCAVVRLDVTQLQHAAADPALNALLRDGWQVLTSVVLDGPDGQYLHLVLRPPSGAVPVEPPPRLPRWSALVLAGAGGAACASLALVLGWWATG